MAVWVLVALHGLSLTVRGSTPVLWCRELLIAVASLFAASLAAEDRVLSSQLQQLQHAELRCLQVHGFGCSWHIRSFQTRTESIAPPLLEWILNNWTTKKVFELIFNTFLLEFAD